MKNQKSKIKNQNFNAKSENEGFTLVELMVTVGIFVFMTALIMARYGTFNQGTLLTNMAYDIALTIRTAQSYGVSVRGTNPDIITQQRFSNPYGVHFDISPAGNAARFVLFSGDYNTVVSSYNLRQGATISKLCNNILDIICSATTLDVGFLRPNPDAIMYENCAETNVCGGGAGLLKPLASAKIVIQSADKSSTRSIMVRSNGQITVGNQ